MHESIPRTGTRGTKGVRNARFLPGSLCRRTITPAQTSMNAKRVPMFVSSTISLILATAETAATTTPVQIVVTCGVRYFGWTLAKCRGRSPSRDMEKNILGWPYWNTRSTALIETTAPNATIPAETSAPTYANAAASGSATPR